MFGIVCILRICTKYTYISDNNRSANSYQTYNNVVDISMNQMIVNKESERVQSNSVFLEKEKRSPIYAIELFTICAHRTFITHTATAQSVGCCLFVFSLAAGSTQSIINNSMNRYRLNGLLHMPQGMLCVENQTNETLNVYTINGNKRHGTTTRSLSLSLSHSPYCQWCPAHLQAHTHTFTARITHLLARNVHTNRIQ